MNNSYDITIIGGGVAGCACAYIAGRLGLKTLLVEKNNYLGGLATGGLVIPMMKTDSKNLNCDFYNDLLSYSEKFLANINYKGENPGWFNPNLLKIVLEQMIINSGAKILYDSQIENLKSEDKIFSFFIKDNGAYIKNKNKLLSIPICSKYLVDGTGSGEICKILGAKFFKDNKKNQPATLRFILSNVDNEKFVDMLAGLNESEDKTSYDIIDGELHFTTAYTWDTNASWALEPYFKQAVKDKVLIESDLEYFQVFSIAKMPNSVAFNCPRLRDAYDSIFSHSNALIEARMAIMRLWNFMKIYIPGFENSYISNIAELTGTRESGRVKCKYDFKASDIICEKHFEDTILHSNYPIDIHSNKKDESVLSINSSYDFPLRSLQVNGFDNLYVVGKCLGADFASHASLRIQKLVCRLGKQLQKLLKFKLNASKVLKTYR